ncbi:MAG: hypothetical protein ACRYFU_13590 [Janthinobacterium lividum]
MTRTKRSKKLKITFPSTTRAMAATVAICVGAGMYTVSAQEMAPRTTAPESVADLALPASSSSLEGSAAPDTSFEAANALPDAPVPQPQTRNHTASRPTPGDRVAPIHSEYIPAGFTAPHWTAHDKIVAGAQDLYSFENIGGIFISASYEYIINSEPNYSPSDAYGKRIGAAAIRETTQSVFSEMVFAPLLHEDPRYYQKGDGHGFIPRTLYAITRPLITRTDGGQATVNGALLLGYAGAAALTPVYYPQINRNFHDTASTFGGSIGGAALGFFVSEFSDDVLRAVHLRRPLK